MSDQLKQAVAHIKSGDKKAGETILLSLLKQDPTNSRAWLYLSAVVNTPEKKRQCLAEAIKHDPANETARNVLAKLNQKHPPPPLYAETEPYEDEEIWLPDSFKTVPPVTVPEPIVSQPVATETAADQAQQRETAWESVVVRDLAAYRRPQDIATKLAERGMDYNQALGFVLYVSRKKKRQIAIRRMPITLLIAIPTFFTGIMFWLTAITPRGLVLGLAMVISSIVGTMVVLKDIFSGGG